MRRIRFFDFGPNTAPPDVVKVMNEWIETEIENSSIEPVDSFHLVNNKPVRSSGNTNNGYAVRMATNMLLLDEMYQWFTKSRQ